MKIRLFLILFPFLLPTIYGVAGPRSHDTQSPAEPSVRINEFMASNGSTVADEDGDFEDWIEIYNAGSEPVDLEGWGLSDDLDEPFRWIFPSVVLHPEEHLIIWGSGKDRKDEPAPSAKSPDAVSGLVSWFKSDAIEGLTDGAAIPSWTDQSGRDNHALQPDISIQPVFESNVLNGLPVVRFNGEDQQFSLPNDSFAGMENFGNFTLITLLRWDGKTTSGIFGTGPSNDNSGNVHFEIVSGGNLRLRVGAMDSIRTPIGGNPGEWSILGFSQTDDDDPTAKVYRDGSVLESRQEGPGDVNLAVFGGIFLGNSHDSNRNFEGMMAEVILFNRALPAKERRAVETYLQKKYDLLTPPIGISPPRKLSHQQLRRTASPHPAGWHSRG